MNISIDVVKSFASTVAKKAPTIVAKAAPVMKEVFPYVATSGVAVFIVKQIDDSKAKKMQKAHQEHLVNLKTIIEKQDAEIKTERREKEEAIEDNSILRADNELLRQALTDKTEEVDNNE